MFNGFSIINSTSSLIYCPGGIILPGGDSNLPKLDQPIKRANLLTLTLKTANQDNVVPGFLYLVNQEKFELYNKNRHDLIYPVCEPSFDSRILILRYFVHNLPTEEFKTFGNLIEIITSIYSEPQVKNYLFSEFQGKSDDNTFCYYQTPNGLEFKRELGLVESNYCLWKRYSNVIEIYGN